MVSWSRSTWPCTIFVAFVALTASKSWGRQRKKINQQMVVASTIANWLKKKSGDWRVSVSLIASAIWGLLISIKKKTNLLMVVICSCLVVFAQKSTVPRKALKNGKLCSDLGTSGFSHRTKLPSQQWQFTLGKWLNHQKLGKQIDL